MTVIMMFSTGPSLVGTLMMATLLYLVVPNNAVCQGGSMDHAISHCFVEYNQQRSNIVFFQGLDVETLRSICNSMKLAVRCTHRKCSNMGQDEFIDALPGEIVNVMDICVYENIIDVYARNQFCFLETATSSERCHNNYQAATQDLLNSVRHGNTRATQRLCLELNKMVQCIRASVSTSCTTEAGSLVELLVRPSIKYSERCPREGISTTTKAPPTQKPTLSLVIDNEELSVKGNGNSGSKMYSTHHIMCSLLTLFLIWIAKPV